MLDSLHDCIVNLIPSKDLRYAIKEKGYLLSDIALLSTVVHCTLDFASRIEYLRMLESAFVGEIKAYTTRIIESQLQMREAFLKQESGVVFELHIKETPDAADETYLCSSLDAAMAMIPLFYREYDSEENDSSRYHIVKRRVFSADKGELFSEDYLGDAVFLPNRTMYSVHVDAFCAEDCDYSCLDCNRYCVHCDRIQYPCFTSHGDVVKYREIDGSASYGVVLQWDDAPTNECYVIPLDSEYIRYHDFKNAHNSHKHVLSVFVEKVTVDCLPSAMQDNCLAYLAFLSENSAWA